MTKHATANSISSPACPDNYARLRPELSVHASIYTSASDMTNSNNISNSKGIYSEKSLSSSPPHFAPIVRYPNHSKKEHFPVWVAAFILVVLSAVFWIGLITISGWFFPVLKELLFT